MQDLTTRRRDKLTAIIERGRNRIQEALTDGGIDPAVARSIAAARMAAIAVAALPTALRTQIETLEAQLSARVATLVRDARKASAEEIADVPIE